MINAIHVFIYSNTHSKIRRIMERQNMTETAAKKHIAKIEKERREYYKYYTDCAWGDKADYDICIDSSKFSKEEIVDYLAQIVSNRIAFLNGLEKKNECDCECKCEVKIEVKKEKVQNKTKANGKSKTKGKSKKVNKK